MVNSCLVLLLRSLSAPKDEVLVEDTDTEARAMSGAPLTVDRPVTDTKLHVLERFDWDGEVWGEAR